MCSFFCQAVRCGSPPSVSQSASGALDGAVCVRCAIRCPAPAEMPSATNPAAIKFRTLFHRKDPDRSAFGHGRKFAWLQLVEPRLHGSRIDAEPGLDGNILRAANAEGRS